MDWVGLGWIGLDLRVGGGIEHLTVLIIMISRDNYVMLLVLVIIENMTLVTIIEMPSVVPLYGNMVLYHAYHNDDIVIDDIDEYNVEIVCY